jgi:nitrite reductase (NADH) small subunit/3-phenylpropionate/trans-cinnamate dioxygenase ferredoxin subunit
MGEFIKATPTSEIPNNQSKICELKGKQVAIFNIEGQFCAIENVCPHRGGPVGEGDLEGKVVTCPWHGWQFDVTTGVSPVNPAAKVKKFNCKVEGADILVEVD